jgi:hypothetical protein
MWVIVGFGDECLVNFYRVWVVKLLAYDKFLGQRIFGVEDCFYCKDGFCLGLLDLVDEPERARADLLQISEAVFRAFLIRAGLIGIDWIVHFLVSRCQKLNKTIPFNNKNQNKRAV